MLQIVIIIVAALVATAPGAVIARIHLHRQQVQVPLEQTIAKFMEIAPGWMKFALISFNFLNFILLCAGANGALYMLTR